MFPGTQHTVWGEVQDEATFAILYGIWTLPTHKNGDMTMLEEPLHFEMRIEDGR